ncbi:MAG: twitching motility protein PilT, partial [Thermovirga sp.]|nr:twitching motility protein PilT [Thermovirga sp.]
MAKKNVKKLLGIFARSLFVFIGAIIGYEVAFVLISKKLWPWENVPHVIVLYLLSVVLFGLIGYIVTPIIIRILGFMGLYFEKSMEGMSWRDISVAIFGLIAGLFVANLAALPFSSLPGVGSYIAITLNIFLGYLGVRLFLNHKEEISSMWTSIGGLKSRLAKTKKEKEPHEELSDVAFSGGSLKILDTSVIIDGRILDIAATGFVEGTFVLPKFVLNELQSIADSTDPLRRTKGRRGLDVIKEMQKV